MKWKRIMEMLLRILWMLRMSPPPRKQCPRPMPDEQEETDAEKPPAMMKAKKQSTKARKRSLTSVESPAAVTFGSSCSRVLPRSQVLSLLHSDCLRSTRKISLLVLHCSDTRPDQDFTIEKLMRSHRARGFGTYPGYHLYVRRDGSLYYCRPISERGCHVKGYNSNSIGICYEGGHSCSPEYKYEDNRTAEQMVVLDEIFTLLHEVYPEARIVGHCELNPCKACPCLDPPASKEYKYIFNA